MSDINGEAAKIWNERLQKCIRDSGYTQESFIKAYREKYRTGTQTDVSRWIRVGLSTTNKKTKKQTMIGFPSYDSMKKIADFFGVTVGYLTGETDFSTFEMERSCSFLGIDEESATAIQNIVNGSGVEHFGHYFASEYRETLKYLLTSQYFGDFIRCLRELGEAKYSQQHPVNHLQNATKQIKSELIPIALHCMDLCDDDLSDEPEIVKKPSEELLEAIRLLSDAQDKGYIQSYELERDVKIAKYELNETIIRLVDEIVCDKHLKSLSMC